MDHFISNWGNYPVVQAQVKETDNVSDIQGFVRHNDHIIARGNGRCYGDASLSKNIVSTLKLNRFLAFDTQHGTLTCQSGVLLADILDLIVPEGYFLPVTPGTKFITVGGAIAADIHGKNHHSEGCFSNHLISFELIDHRGALHTCSRTENPELFADTIGSMGMTGIIVSATFYLKPIQSAYIHYESIKARNLDEIMDYFDQYKNWNYSVAWIDCLQKGAKQGRSILMLGEHAEPHELPAKLRTNPFDIKPKKKFNIPVYFPDFALNTMSVKAFNYLYYYKQRQTHIRKIVDYDTWFYPLDAIQNWNRMYGKKGFTQYQFVLPKPASKVGLSRILTEINKSGQGSFLAVLKLFGKLDSISRHSFPMEGYTLALDFKIQKGLDQLLEALDDIVIDHGGRLYLAKDAFMKKNMFRETYPDFPKSEKFNSVQYERLGVR